MWCEDHIGWFKNSGIYSSGNRFEEFATKKNMFLVMQEYYGVVSVSVTNFKDLSKCKTYQIFSSYDLEVLKSCLLNNGWNIDWYTFNIIVKLFYEFESNGFPLCRIESSHYSPITCFMEI